MKAADTGLLEEIYRRLYACRGHQGWWPGQTPLEVAVGAVLTQNTAWTNVEKAIHALRKAGVLDAQRLLDIDQGRLAALIRPAGYFNVKAGRLKNLVRFLVEETGGEVTGLARLGVEGARKSLLSINGVGRETADSILLYALGMPVFVVDAYTRRIFGRMGVLDPGADYDEIRALFETALGPDAELFNDYHAQIVVHGKEVCRKTPACGDCVLGDLCGFERER